MIRRLRIRHRRTFAVLAILLPIGFFAALAVRPEFGISATSARELLGHPGESTVEPGARVVRDGDRSWIEVRPRVDLQLPDVLVYMTSSSSGGEALPDDALLIGVLAGLQPRRFPVPAGARTEEARLILFSLAHDAIVGQMDL